MIVQAAAIWGILESDRFTVWVLGSVFLGLGTAMVYPTLLAAVGDAAAPERRASTLGVYRFWRDAGYAAGALGAGLAADALGLRWAIRATALLTLLSGLQVAIAMPKGGRLWPSPVR
jgi:MFS family permease